MWAKRRAPGSRLPARDRAASISVVLRSHMRCQARVPAPARDDLEGVCSPRQPDGRYSVHAPCPLSTWGPPAPPTVDGAPLTASAPARHASRAVDVYDLPLLAAEGAGAWGGQRVYRLRKVPRVRRRLSCFRLGPPRLSRVGQKQIALRKSQTLRITG